MFEAVERTLANPISAPYNAVMPDATLKAPNVLDSSVPALTENEARALLAETYAIEGRLTALTGERDRNFHVRSSDNREFVLKITNPAEPREITRFQTAALLQIARVDPALPVPQVMPTRSGGMERLVELPRQAPSVVRLLTYLQGEPLSRAQRSPAQCRNIARCLAALGLALKDAPAPSIPHELQWDTKHTPKLRSKLGALSDPGQYARVARVLDGFDDYVVPRLPGLRCQVVHNDFNPYNILVAPDDPTRVTGIIDFGDMVETPLIIDIATAAAYQVLPDGNPLQSIGDFVAAYHAISPLLEEEIELFFDLVKARLITTIVVATWRAQRYPENSAYILRNAHSAWSSLGALESVQRDAARDYFLHACNSREADEA